VRFYVPNYYDIYKNPFFDVVLVVGFLNPLEIPHDHQQLRDHKSHNIWLRRRYMFWEHIFHCLSRWDYSRRGALTIYTYKEALILTQQCQPLLFRHLQKLCRIPGCFHLNRYKQLYLFYDISEL